MDAKKNKGYFGLLILALILFLFVFASEKMFFVLSVFKPVMMGIVIAYLLDGMVRFLNRNLKLKRGISIVIVIVGVIAIAALCVYFAVPFLLATVMDLVNYISSLISGHNSGLYDLAGKIADALNFDLSTFDVYSIDKTLLDTINGTAQKMSGLLVNSIVSVGSSVMNVVTSVMMAVYMLVEKKSLLEWLRRIVKASFSEAKANYILEAFSMTNSVFKKFIIGKFIDSTIIGILCIVLFSVFGIEYALVFGIITGIGNMIPYFGPIFSAIPVVLILLIINPKNAVIALLIIIVVQILDGNVIGPKILSDNIGVSAFWILFAVTVCGIAFGFVGMIVGVPLVVVIKNLIEDFVRFRFKQRGIEEPEEITNETEVEVQNVEEPQSEA